MHPALRAFRSKSFRIFYAGQGLSLLGNWMQSVAMSWLVYRLTGSALLLGITAGAQQLPMLLLSPIAGVWADRVNRRRLLMVIQCLAFLQALALALLTFLDLVQVPYVIALAAFGEAWCFLANAIAYLAIIATYLVVRVTPRNVPKPDSGWWRQLAAGFGYAFGYTGTQRLLLLLAAVGFFTAPWSSLMPIFA